MSVRPAVSADAPVLARLHAERIASGFLASLGPEFLTRLYRRVVAAPDAFAVVAEEDGTVVGFAAVAQDLRRLYARFLLRDGLGVARHHARPLLRRARRVAETLRYTARASAGSPAGSRAPRDPLPAAEVLAVAVDPAAGGRGLGGALVAAALAELGRRGVGAAKVVVGADNERALALYRRAGFAGHSTTGVHSGVPSEVLVWRR